MDKYLNNLPCLLPFQKRHKNNAYMYDAKGRNNAPLSTAKGDKDAVGHMKSVITNVNDPQFTFINTTDPLNFTTEEKAISLELIYVKEKD